MSDAPLIENEIATEKPRKPRKPRAKKPAADKPPRAPRSSPVRTLASWLRGRGPNHEEAAGILGAPFKSDLRYALAAQERLTKAQGRVQRAEKALAEAQGAVDALVGYDPLPVYARLDDLAASITKAKDATRVPGVEEPKS